MTGRSALAAAGGGVFAGVLLYVLGALAPPEVGAVLIAVFIIGTAASCIWDLIRPDQRIRATTSPEPR